MATVPALSSPTKAPSLPFSSSDPPTIVTAQSPLSSKKSRSNLASASGHPPSSSTGNLPPSSVPVHPYSTNPRPSPSSKISRPSPDLFISGLDQVLRPTSPSNTCDSALRSSDSVFIQPSQSDFTSLSGLNQGFPPLNSCVASFSGENHRLPPLYASGATADLAILQKGVAFAALPSSGTVPINGSLLSDRSASASGLRPTASTVFVTENPSISADPPASSPQLLPVVPTDISAGPLRAPDPTPQLTNDNNAAISNYSHRASETLTHSIPPPMSAGSVPTAVATSATSQQQILHHNRIPTPPPRGAGKLCS